jgi:acetolactate synthase-1/2/3 large subunit
VTRTDEFAAAFQRACASPTGGVIELPIATEALSPRATIAGLRAAAKSQPNPN